MLNGYSLYHTFIEEHKLKDKNGIIFVDKVTYGTID